MSLLFLLDAAGSYVLATRLADRVYDGELMEIARELVLHAKRDGTKIAFDLEADAERTTEHAARLVDHRARTAEGGQHAARFGQQCFAGG